MTHGSLEKRKLHFLAAAHCSLAHPRPSILSRNGSLLRPPPQQRILAPPLPTAACECDATVGAHGLRTTRRVKPKSIVFPCSSSPSPSGSDSALPVSPARSLCVAFIEIVMRASICGTCRRKGEKRTQRESGEGGTKKRSSERAARRHFHLRFKTAQYAFGKIYHSNEGVCNVGTVCRKWVNVA